MAIELKELGSDNETNISNAANVISLNPAEEEEKLIILIACQRGEISILCIFSAEALGN